MMVERLPYSAKFDNGLDVNRAGLSERLKPKCVLCTRDIFISFTLQELMSECLSLM